MDVKEAVRTAKEYIAELFTDETITNIGLEEVEFNDTSNNWEVTIGFSRSWAINALVATLSHQPPTRSYKLVCINDASGKVLSLKDRVLTASQ